MSTIESIVYMFYQELTVNADKYVPVNVNDHITTLQLDSASDITLISRKTWYSSYYRLHKE